MERINENEFFISDLSLHSIGILLFRKMQHQVLWQFLNDMLIQTAMNVTSLPLEMMKSVIKASQKNSLDFDDAYQYTAAERFDLSIASFDGDFDRTAKGRKEATLGNITVRSAWNEKRNNMRGSVSQTG